MPRKPGPRPADKSESKVFTFVLPIALIDEIDVIAGQERRSRVRMVEVALADFVRQYRAQEPDPLARHLAPPSAREVAVRRKDDAA
jgi:hypothetical protein